MDRRTVLAALAAALPVLRASAEDRGVPEPREEHHHLGGHHPRAALIEATSHCIAVAEICLDHCHGMLSSGDTSMAGCARSSSSVIAVCTALRSLAAENAPATGALARVAAQVCEDCEKECRKFAKEHEVCRDCMDACADCGKLCRQSAA